MSRHAACSAWHSTLYATCMRQWLADTHIHTQAHTLMQLDKLLVQQLSKVMTLCQPVWTVSFRYAAWLAGVNGLFFRASQAIQAVRQPIWAAIKLNWHLSADLCARLINAASVRAQQRRAPIDRPRSVCCIEYTHSYMPYTIYNLDFLISINCNNLLATFGHLTTSQALNLIIFNISLTLSLWLSLALALTL